MNSWSQTRWVNLNCKKKQKHFSSKRLITMREREDLHKVEVLRDLVMRIFDIHETVKIHHDKLIILVFFSSRSSSLQVVAIGRRTGIKIETFSIIPRKSAPILNFKATMAARQLHITEKMSSNSIVESGTSNVLPTSSRWRIGSEYGIPRDCGVGGSHVLRLLFVCRWNVDCNFVPQILIPKTAQ